MIRAADTDGSGVVEFNEFLEMMAENMEVRWSVSRSEGGSKRYMSWEKFW